MPPSSSSSKVWGFASTKVADPPSTEVEIGSDAFARGSAMLRGAPSHGMRLLSSRAGPATIAHPRPSQRRWASSDAAPSPSSSEASPNDLASIEDDINVLIRQRNFNGLVKTYEDYRANTPESVALYGKFVPNMRVFNAYLASVSRQAHGRHGANAAMLKALEEHEPLFEDHKRENGQCGYDIDTLDVILQHGAAHREAGAVLDMCRPVVKLPFNAEGAPMIRLAMVALRDCLAADNQIVVMGLYEYITSIIHCGTDFDKDELSEVSVQVTEYFIGKNNFLYLQNVLKDIQSRGGTVKMSLLSDWLGKAAKEANITLGSAILTVRQHALQLEGTFRLEMGTAMQIVNAAVRLRRLDIGEIVAEGIAPFRDTKPPLDLLYALAHLYALGYDAEEYMRPKVEEAFKLLKVMEDLYGDEVTPFSLLPLSRAILDNGLEWDVDPQSGRPIGRRLDNGEPDMDRFLDNLDAAFVTLKNLGNETSLVGLNLLILTCARTQSVGQALELFEEMEETFGFKPNVHTYSALMEVLKFDNRQKAIIQLHGQMQQEGIEPDFKADAQAIRAAIRMEDVAFIAARLDELREQGKPVSMDVVNAVVEYLRMVYEEEREGRAPPAHTEDVANLKAAVRPMWQKCGFYDEDSAWIATHVLECESDNL